MMKVINYYMEEQKLMRRKCKSLLNLDSGFLDRFNGKVCRFNRQGFLETYTADKVSRQRHRSKSSNEQRKIQSSISTETKNSTQSIKLPKIGKLIKVQYQCSKSGMKNKQNRLTIIRREKQNNKSENACLPANKESKELKKLETGKKNIKM